MAETTYEWTNRYGKTYVVRLARAKYQSNDTLAVCMENLADDGDYWEPYATATVNIVPESDMFVGTTKAFVDVNNLGDGIVSWLEENGIARLSGEMAESGYCVYPAMEFLPSAIGD